MSIELWNSRILTNSEKQKRFTFFNPHTNGLGSWIEFIEITGFETNGTKVQLLKFRFECGEGFLNIADTEGNVREPFYDRTWFYGELTRQEKTCMTRFRFVDEHSGGSEQGTRIFTHWRHGPWKEMPKQDRNGNLIKVDTSISFGWSVNGNAYYCEAKPAESAESSKEMAKAPKSFVPKPNPSADMKFEEVKTDAVPVKKPKIFVPKSKQGDTTTS